MEATNKTGIWVEDFRPKKIEDVILPQRIKEPFTAMIQSGEIMNCLFEGPSGCGKTTLAVALCEELGADYLIINGSDESGIDVLRNKVRIFASLSSIVSESRHKIVIFDEADYLNASSTQPALRNFIEEFSNTARFIFTCNYSSRIIPALHSRCTVVPFKFTSDEMAKMAALFFSRACDILDRNSITYDKKSVASVVKKYFPDFRRTLNELQAYSKRTGCIDAGIVAASSDAKVETLFGFMKSKDFRSVRQFFEDNSDISPAELFDGMYKNLNSFIDPSTIPSAIVLLADYQYKSSFAANQTINSVAACASLMMECKFV